MSSPVARRASRALLLVLMSLGVWMATPSFAAEPNLLLNGDLAAGQGDAPEHWTRTPFAPRKTLVWSHPQGEPATLEIVTGTSSHHHTSYFNQTVNLLQPGWYYLRAEVKTENFETSAAIKVEGSHAAAVATQANKQWLPMELYFKIGGPEAVQIGCGAHATPSGSAFFRNLTLRRISGAPPFGANQFDITRDIHMSHWETMAMIGVDLAKTPSDESLLRDVLRLPVVVSMLLTLMALAWLDWRYATRGGSREARRLRSFLHHPEAPRSVAVAASLCLLLLGTWLVTRVEYLPGHGFYKVEPRAISGDEPHYLVMINSLLLKHNLQLQTAYDDAYRGGPEAGVVARGVPLDRQTIVVNRRTGHSAMGSVEGRLWHRNAAPEFAPSAEVYEVPVHPRGFPLLMALAVAPMQPRAREVEPAVGFILMIISWLGLVVTYFIGRKVDMGRGWAMLVAVILFAASPWLAYSRAYFAETTIGLTLLLGLWAFMSDFPVLAALAAGAGAILKPAFVLVGPGFLAEEVREKRWWAALKIAIVLGLPALDILTFNFWVNRSYLDLHLQWGFDWRQMGNTLIGPAEGLLRYAPWTVLGFLACGRAFLSPQNKSRLARTMALPLFMYLIVLSSIGFGPGYCFGPRYWIAFLPWLALATVEGMRLGGRYQRALCAVLVLCAIALAIPDALRYPHLFDRPALDAWRGFY